MDEPIIRKHGGYRKLVAYQLSEAVYDITFAFTQRAYGGRGRMTDQMVQAARSGKQNIAEGSAASGTSSKTEIRLVGVARASLEELKIDYEDYLRQHDQETWPKEAPKATFIRNLRHDHRPPTPCTGSMSKRGPWRMRRTSPSV